MPKHKNRNGFEFTPQNRNCKKHVTVKSLRKKNEKSPFCIKSVIPETNNRIMTIPEALMMIDRAIVSIQILVSDLSDNAQRLHAVARAHKYSVSNIYKLSRIPPSSGSRTLKGDGNHQLGARQEEILGELRF